MSWEIFLTSPFPHPLSHEAVWKLYNYDAVQGEKSGGIAQKKLRRDHRWRLMV